LESRIGPVLLVEKGGPVSERSYKIQVLDKNINLLDTYCSLRAAAKSLGISPSSAHQAAPLTSNVVMRGGLVQLI
jgi:hypothetical protein